MKKLFALPLLLGLILSLCGAAVVPVDTTAPASTLPEEYLVMKRSGEDGYSEYQWFPAAADVRRVKALLPDYDGGAMVDKELSGKPIKIRYVVGTTAYAYEIFPDDLIVWWYDMKCATVKGAYNTVNTMLTNAPAPTDAPRVEAREYGAGDHFVHYAFLTEPTAVQPFLDCLTNMEPVEKLVGPLPAGGAIVSAELIRGLDSESYYIFPYGYAQSQSTSELYRLKPGAVDLLWSEIGLFASQPAQYAMLTYWPGNEELERSRVYYPREYLTATYGTAGEGGISLEQVTSALKNKKAEGEHLSENTPILVTLLKNGKISERYLVFDDSSLHDTLADKWYTVPEGTFETLLKYYQVRS